MILDRVLGAVADLEQPLDHWHDPSLEPNWGYKHPAEIDSSVPLEDIIEADRAARDLIEGMRKEREEFQPREETGPCHECGYDSPCEYHATAEELSRSEEEVLMTAPRHEEPGHLPRPHLLRRKRPPPPPPPGPHRRLLTISKGRGEPALSLSKGRRAPNPPQLPI